MTKQGGMDSRFKKYQKRTVQLLRPYEVGEDLDGVSVWEGDVPEEGGMIAINAEDHTDQWYVGKAFYDTNYVEAEDE